MSETARPKALILCSEPLPNLLNGQKRPLLRFYTFSLDSYKVEVLHPVNFVNKINETADLSKFKARLKVTMLSYTKFTFINSRSQVSRPGPRALL